MGYYTRYTLAVTPDSEEIWREIAKKYDILYKIVSSGGSGKLCKCYDHEYDMIELSKKFPEVTFCLHGEGEESVDIWDEYFRNGKKQICKAEIVIPKMREDGWV